MHEIRGLVVTSEAVDASPPAGSAVPMLNETRQTVTVETTDGAAIYSEVPL